MLNIILNSEDVIAEISQRAKDSKVIGHKLGADKTNNAAQGSKEPRPKTDTNAELGKLAGVSKATCR